MAAVTSRSSAAATPTPARAERQYRHPRHGRSRPAPEPGAAAHTPSRPRRFALQSGDHLLLYTDGVSETRDAAGAFFPLAAWAQKQLTTPPRQALSNLHQALLDHSGDNLNDDIAAIAILRTS